MRKVDVVHMKSAGAEKRTCWVLFLGRKHSLRIPLSRKTFQSHDSILHDFAAEAATREMQKWFKEETGVQTFPRIRKDSAENP